MRRVFEAVQAYRRLHQGEYPERLMDLGKLGFIRGEIDICPCVIDSLPFSSRPGGTWSSGGEGLETSLAYQYELSSQPILAAYLPNNVKATWRQFKLLLVSRQGWEDVPILRCERHSKTGGRLNMTFAGGSYASGTFWEELFVDRVPSTYRTPYLAFTRNVPPFPQHTNPPDYPEECVKLDGAANAIPGDPWWWGNRMNAKKQTAATLKPLLDESEGGLVRIGEQIFDVRSVVQVQGAIVPSDQYGRGFNIRAFPTRREIPLGRTFRESAILCGTVWEGRLGTVAGRLIWKYKNGQQAVYQMVMGDCIDCFQREPNPRASARPFWSGSESEAARVLYRATWINERPTEEVTSVEFVADPDSAASPFIVAISLIP
jgi:hypothetical protein